MIKKFAIAILLILDLTYMMIIGSFLREPLRKYIVEPRLIRQSYIYDIKGDLLDTQLVKKHLDIFNNYGHNHIVKYSPDTVPNRPITIEIRKLDQGLYEKIRGPFILGYTEAPDKNCTIILTNDMKTEVQFRQTLIHEFLHCYFYDHTPDPQDLMYYEENNASEANIKKYAEEVEKRIQ